MWGWNMICLRMIHIPGIFMDNTGVLFVFQVKTVNGTMTTAKTTPV